MKTYFSITMSQHSYGDGKVFSTYTKRTGHVDDGQVWYIQNVQKYTSLSELDIDSETVSEGDRIVLYFDNVTDELLFGVPEEVADGKAKKAVFLLLGFAVAFVVYMTVCGIIGRKTVFKDFQVWYQLYKSGKA